MKKKNVIIVGGGPAGLIAGIEASKRGSNVILLEKMNRPARKLRITGKGRCNLTNIAPLEEFISHFGKHGRFLRSAFSCFFSHDLIHFMSDLGINTINERGGRIFPMSENAEDVVNALINFAKKNKIKIQTDTVVKKILFEGDKVVAVEAFCKGIEKKEIISCDAVILATGGASYRATGSTGDGYKLASLAGHRIIKIRPALVPLNTFGNTASRLQGVSLRNVNVSAWFNGKKRLEKFGEMLFTHFGVTGPVILNLSRNIVDALNEKQRVELSIDLKPALNHKELDKRILRDLSTHGKKQFNKLLKLLLPKKLIAVCIDETGIPSEKIGHQILAGDRAKLKNWLKDFRLKVTGYRPINEAIITAGGVDTREIDPKTMESRLKKGLYFAGEVLDVDADTGGYNLQAAFSTGVLSGTSVSRK